MIEHPATFSAPILDALEALLAARVPAASTVLDPFAGVGTIHRLDNWNTWGVEIEPEWVSEHPRNICGDSRRLDEIVAEANLGPVAAIVTSPSYGNRLADQYLGSDREKCRLCNGTGLMYGPDNNPEFCPQCKGTGKAPSKRAGYAVSLGRVCSDGSGAALQWGDTYRDLHGDIWARCVDVLEPGGWMMVNVSNHVRGGVQQPVVEWHTTCLLDLGLYLDEVLRIQTRRYRFGSNAERRVDAERILVLRKGLDA